MGAAALGLAGFLTKEYIENLDSLAKSKSKITKLIGEGAGLETPSQKSEAISSQKMSVTDAGGGDMFEEQSDDDRLADPSKQEKILGDNRPIQLRHLAPTQSLTPLGIDAVLKGISDGAEAPRGRLEDKFKM